MSDALEQLFKAYGEVPAVPKVEYAHVYRTADRTGWRSGPWDAEPDKGQWVDPVTGLDCLVVRQRESGHLCGYVGVAEGSPLYRLDFTALPDEVAVHGGLTFSASCDEDGDEREAICHIPLPGRPGAVWWFGFDCAHLMDLAPNGVVYRLTGRELTRGAVYRSWDYVVAQTTALAAQLQTLTADGQL